MNHRYGSKWDIQKNRISATIKLVKKLGKNPNQITQKDFNDNGFNGIVRAAKGYHNALIEAGFNDDRTIRKPVGYWRNKNNRIKETKKLVMSLNKDPEYIRINDFNNNRLAILVIEAGGYIKALKEAGFIQKRQRKNKAGHWLIKRNRIKAVRDLVTRLNKPLIKISYSDFNKHGLSGIIYHFKVPELLQEAGFKVRNKTPKKSGYWDIKKNRIKETRQLVEKSNKPVDEIERLDFLNAQLYCLLKKSKGYRNALQEAGYKLIFPNPRKTKPKKQKRKAIKKSKITWDSKDERIKAIKNVVTKVNKPLHLIILKDFYKCGYDDLISYYNRSLYAAFKEAGFKIKPWQVRTIEKDLWEDKNNIIAAIRWVVENSEKNPNNVTYDDFNKVRLGRLIKRFGILQSLEMAGYDVSKRWKPANYWTKTRTIKRIREIVRKSGKKPEEITYYDFIKHHFNHIIDKKYGSSPIKAILDAGYKLPQKILEYRLSHTNRKKYLSNHGHKFISIFERDIDNWLWNHGLKNHNHDVPYPNSRLNCDFVIGNFWIEAAGRTGNKEYDKRIERKIKIAKKNNLNLTIITLKDFLRKNNLEQKLAHVLRAYGNTYNEKLSVFN